MKQHLPESFKSRLKKVLQPHSIAMSQAGQDAWVYGEVFDEKRDGYFVDIGAHDGVYLSNTYLLEKRYRWKGLLIEANPESFRSLQRNRSSTCIKACLDETEGKVQFSPKGVMGGIVSEETRNPDIPSADTLTLRATRLSRVLEEHNAPSVIDYLSIDVEGAEERVLRSFDFEQYRFLAATIEMPSASLRSLLASKGYILIKNTPGLDCFYIHESHKEEFLMNTYRFFNKKFLRLRWS